MRRYTLHAPPPVSVPATGALAGPDARPVRMPQLVPEGFSFWAFLLPPLWLLLHRQWLALVLWIALSVIAAFLLPPAVLPFATTAAHLLLGLQAQDLRRWTLARHGLPVAGVILARNAEAALLRALRARPDLARSVLA